MRYRGNTRVDFWLMGITCHLFVSCHIYQGFFSKKTIFAKLLAAHVSFAVAAVQKTLLNN